ncbi:hypothetical protein [Labrys wisconsinensis]|uniref:Uncharacterized protein n=1 Tax=Labrys wisconsinensis TaxID=425677 RepID=A0ABU0JJV5_9HYPH|nr:hypothetical protein [Labrys wisconsinensis]MDQ0474544.1 hypothetical protein [Labrys wisconsinensis]
MKRWLAMAALTMAAWPAQAQTLADVEARQQAVIEAWEKTPLTQRRAIFVTARPSAYGAYVERSSNVFKPGEPLVTYVEPVGYLWKETAPDTYSFGILADFLVTSPSGDVLGGKEGFVRYVQESHYRNQELMLTLTLNLTGAPPGKYIVKYTIHDVNSAKASTFQQPFEVAN